MKTALVYQPYRNDFYWERMWACYPESDYQQVLHLLGPEETVLEIGAGDLRLARQISKAARRVYAIEIQEGLSKDTPEGLPANLVVIRGDARSFPFPPVTTSAVLLMRHCTHFKLYARKLKRAGCARLITNARWGVGVETIWLQKPRQNYGEFLMGWYACWCGKTGFKTGPVEYLTPQIENVVHEVASCPHCAKGV